MTASHHQTQPAGHATAQASAQEITYVNEALVQQVAERGELGAKRAAAKAALATANLGV
ncbi:MAG: hypothetical protein HQ446_05180 [Polaromonas sp.]|nr:hypothetical protein [Polaromonas sp.]